MKETLKLQIQMSMTKLSNIQKQASDIETKIVKLQKQLLELEKASEEQVQFVSQLGLKTPRRDGNSETTEELSAKRAYNQDLYRQKLDLIKQFYPQFYEDFNKLEFLPEHLRNLDI